MIRKTYKYRIYPNKETEKKLFWTLTRCRELYNAALSERRDSYKYAKKSISYYDQQNDLPEIKQEIREEYQDIAAHVLQDVLKRLDKAFQGFFRRVKNGQTPGYPRFQGRDRYDSFTYPDSAGWKMEGKRLHLSKIGDVKVKLHRPLQGVIKTVTIKREVDHWPRSHVKSSNLRSFPCLMKTVAYRLLRVEIPQSLPSWSAKPTLSKRYATMKT